VALKRTGKASVSLLVIDTVAKLIVLAASCLRCPGFLAIGETGNICLKLSCLQSWE